MGVKKHHKRSNTGNERITNYKESIYRVSEWRTITFYVFYIRGNTGGERWSREAEGGRVRREVEMKRKSDGEVEGRGSGKMEECIEGGVRRWLVGSEVDE